LISDIAVVDQVLGTHAGALGGDLVAYRNHVYRVVNLCVRLASATGEELHRIAIAAVFHDLGIWTAGTFDYLRPSVALAKAYLLRSSAVDLVPEVEAMILEHHKISPYRGASQPLVEAFRKADWIDVSRGFLIFGIPRRFVAELYAKWPSAGFHRRLVQLSLSRFRSNPWSPLPMVRW
jgi:hypothetical protein